MLGLRSKSRFDYQKMRRKAQTGTFRSLSHAGAVIRKAAVQSIRPPAAGIQGRDAQGHFTRVQRPAPVGQPPYTRTRRLPKAILYAVDKRRQSVVIGPARHLIGTVGRPHERGGRYKRQVYPARPFMRPALRKVKHRIPYKWTHSIVN